MEVLLRKYRPLVYVFAILTCIIAETNMAAAFQKTSEIQLLNPRNTQRYFVGKQIAFNWKDIGNSERVLIYVGGKEIADTENDGSYIWEIPTNFPIGNYQIKILNLNGEEDMTSSDITIMAECQVPANAESISYEVNETNVYFPLLPKHAKRQFQETKGDWLHVKYREQYRKEVSAADKIEGAIYDWRKNRLATIKLNRAFGMNHYSIDLSKLCGNLKPSKEYYIFEIMDENADIFSVLFQYTIDDTQLQTGILMNPILWNCGVENGNEIEYVGNIEGGTAPYTVTWHVSTSPNKEDAFRTEVKEQKKQQKSSITVYDQPGYYVIMEVKDSCGKVGEKVAQIQCQGKKKNNQVTIQIIDNPSTTTE